MAWLLKGLCDSRKVIHIRVTCFSEAMEGHFDCKLIAEVENSCEVVICPSRAIYRSCKVNLLLSLQRTTIIHCYLRM
jgi:hypothetical protein